MSKAPIILIGGAAIVGVAVLASKASGGTTAKATTATPGKTAKDMTDAQRAKLSKWAKEKGVPLEKAWDLAQSVYGGLKL